jgi:UPF0176 protein
MLTGEDKKNLQAMLLDCWGSRRLVKPPHRRVPAVTSLLPVMGYSCGFSVSRDTLLAGKRLSKELLELMSGVLIATFYHFTSLPDFCSLRESLRAKCIEHSLKGSVLLAEEGINGTLAGSAAALRTFLGFLRDDERFSAMQHKESWSDVAPFVRLKVRLKNEIVTLGVPHVDPSVETGEHVKPVDWNALIEQPDVVVLDARNRYETEMGSFDGALQPETSSFGEFPEWVHNNQQLTPETRIAMFCTGGIRCEKASAYLLQQGFENVYQLEGGILKYLEDVAAENSLFAGECYVFDSRVSVNHQLESGSFEMCCACGRPVSDEQRRNQMFIPGVACPRCHEETSAEQKAGFAERQKQVDLALRRNASHFEAQTSGRKSESE